MLQHRIIRRSPHEWNVLEGGPKDAPLILFLHGAGASSQSFGAVMEELSNDYRVVAPDLPGHGRTRLGSGQRSSLDCMTADITLLMDTEYAVPKLVVGHSAGGAIAVRLSETLSPRGHILINPALSPFTGPAGWAFPALAKGLVATPFAADVITGLVGRPRRIAALLDATGSEINEEIFERYLALARDSQHIRGTLKMMAAWDVRNLASKLEGIKDNTLCLLGANDGTVPIAEAKRSLASIQQDRISVLQGGHLLHEEHPKDVAKIIHDFAMAM